MSESTPSDTLSTMAPYIRYIADRLTLKDWKIDIEADSSLDDCHAEISCINGRRRAVIAFGSHFFSDDAQGKTHTIVHELIHCHLNNIRIQVDTLRNALGAMLFDPIWEGHTAQIEASTDALADAFAPLMPTFEDWKKPPDLCC